ncbi:hypothetical protein LINGRAHAP2_LOCUS14392 [Linum grandiflorum]
MAEDFKYRQRQLAEDPMLRPELGNLFNDVLRALETLLHTYSSSLAYYHLPLPATNFQNPFMNFVSTHLDYDSVTEAANATTYRSSLNEQQKNAYTEIALVVASSGIAATLLLDGVTTHSRFKIPLDVDHLSTCSVRKGTDLAQLLQMATLIVWDEAPMIHRLSYEAVDRTLCDIMNVPLMGPDY